jgi:hypothetical protein
MIKGLTFACRFMFAVAAVAVAATRTPAQTPQGTKSSSRPTSSHSSTSKMSISGKAQTKNCTPLADARVELIPVGQLSNAKGSHISVTTAPDGTFQANVPWAGDCIYGVSLGILLCQGRIQPPLLPAGTDPFICAWGAEGWRGI